MIGDSVLMVMAMVMMMVVVVFDDNCTIFRTLPHTPKLDVQEAKRTLGLS